MAYLKSLLFLMLLFVTACNRHPKPIIKNNDAYIKNLITYKIKGTSYTIAIPSNYTIKVHNGHDFLVFYFYPADTTNKKDFRGGVYLGNAPGSFEYGNEKCKIDSVKSYILDEEHKWSVYTCPNQIKTEIITKNKPGKDWLEYIHAFGQCNSKTNLTKLLEVYSTITLN